MTAQFYSWSMYPSTTPLRAGALDSRSSRRKSTSTVDLPDASPISRTSSESSSNTLRQAVTSPASTSPFAHSTNQGHLPGIGLGLSHSHSGETVGPGPGHLLRSNSTSTKSAKQKRTHRFRHTRTSSSNSVGTASINPAAAAALSPTATSAAKVGRVSHETSLWRPGLLHRLDPTSASDIHRADTGAASGLSNNTTAAAAATGAHPQVAVDHRQKPHPLARAVAFVGGSSSGGSSSTTAKEKPNKTDAVTAEALADPASPVAASPASPAGLGSSTAAAETHHPTHSQLQGRLPQNQAPAALSSAPARSPETPAAASASATAPIINTPTGTTQNSHHSRSHHSHHSHSHSHAQTRAHRNKLAKLAATETPPFHPQRIGLSASELKYVVMLTDQEAPSSKVSKLNQPVHAGRNESSSTLSGAASLLSAARTMTTTSSDPSTSVDAIATKPFVLKNGRTYFNDPTLPYPLPVDLTELHRQSLRTLLLIQVFGGPVCSPSFATRPPARVLEVGCGSGFWSMMCHRYFRDRGHSGISFTGLDIAPLAPGSGGSPSNDAAKPDRDMNWRFVQHDIRVTPFPFQDGEFDLVMVKDMGLAATNTHQQRLMDEYLRMLKTGGCLEIWESDHTIRMLRPHVPGTTGSAGDEDEEHDAAASLGAYVMSANTPLSPPLNNFLVEYNGWLLRALESRDLCAVPCTRVGPALLQESEHLSDVRSRRLAIPLSEVRWEKEGVSGVVTKDGKSYIETKGKSARADADRRTLSAGQAALRRTALMTVMQQVQSLEPVLREVSGKRQDEWDNWIGKMMNDLLKENGTSWGECLEVGAWWAKKKKR